MNEISDEGDLAVVPGQSGCVSPTALRKARGGLHRRNAGNAGKVWRSVMRSVKHASVEAIMEPQHRWLWRHVRKAMYLGRLACYYGEDRCFPMLGRSLGRSRGSAVSWRAYLAQTRCRLEEMRVPLDGVALAQRIQELRECGPRVLGRRLGGPIDHEAFDWCCDPRTGFRWSNGTWYRFCRRETASGEDIKVPLDLSTCRHLIPLGEGYRVLNDAAAATDIVRQMTHWIGQNPYRFGPGWDHSMIVGIRVANWIVALLYILDTDDLTDAILEDVFTSVERHCTFIRQNLENRAVVNNNHYMADLAGLFFACCFLPESRKVRSWKLFARRELEKEIFGQTYADGWLAEGSTCYHRLVVEFLLYCFLADGGSRSGFSTEFQEHLRQMVRVLIQFRGRDGCLPQCGDNDSGRFIPFNADHETHCRNLDYLVVTAQRLGWLEAKDCTAAERVYRSAGLYRFSNDSLDVFITAGPKGLGGLGGHAHNDVLACEFHADGVPIAVDPGSYVYTGSEEERNRFRSIAAHNTLFWPGIEPCSLDHGVFRLYEAGKLKVDVMSSADGSAGLDGTYEYGGRWHKRRVVCFPERGKVLIEDSCSHDGAVLNMTLMPGLQAEMHGNALQIGPALIRYDGVRRIWCEPGWYSPGYGEKTSCVKIRAAVQGRQSTQTIVVNRG